MAVANNYVQGKGNAASSATSCAIVFDNNIGTGKRLITIGLIDYRPSLGGTLSLTDSLGTTYTQRVTATLAAALAIYIYDGFAVSTGGANTVTASYGATSQTSIVLAGHEYKDMDTAAAYDSGAAAVALSGTAVDSGAFTTAKPGEVLFGFGTMTTSVTAGTNEAYGLQVTIGASTATEDVIKMVAGSTNVQFTAGGSGAWLCAGACYKRRIMLPHSLDGIGAVGSKSRGLGLE